MINFRGVVKCQKRRMKGFLAGSPLVQNKYLSNNPYPMEKIPAYLEAYSHLVT